MFSFFFPPIKLIFLSGVTRFTYFFYFLSPAGGFTTNIIITSISLSRCFCRIFTPISRPVTRMLKHLPCPCLWSGIGVSCEKTATAYEEICVSLSLLGTNNELIHLIFYFINHAAKQLSCVLQHAQNLSKKAPLNWGAHLVKLLQTEHGMIQKYL